MKNFIAAVKRACEGGDPQFMCYDKHVASIIIKDMCKGSYLREDKNKSDTDNNFKTRNIDDYKNVIFDRILFTKR
jgi:hypothetical protein